MPIKTMDAIKAFGSKRKICITLGIEAQNATAWGYFVPSCYDEKLFAECSTEWLTRLKSNNSESDLKALGLDPQKEIERRKQMLSLLNTGQAEVFFINSIEYKLLPEIDKAIKLQSALKRGDALYFYNHDEMMAASDFNLKRCLELFKLYPIYKKVV